jgi:hypothetical protein
MGETNDIAINTAESYPKKQFVKKVWIFIPGISTVGII